MSEIQSWCCVHVGSVISVNKWSDTHVSSSGGGGYVNKHGGYVSAPTVSSTITQNIELFSRSDSGQEKKIALANVNISFREGSKVLAVWGAEDGTDTGPFYYIENLDTHEVYAPEIPLCLDGWYGIFNGLGRAMLLTAFAIIPFLLLPESFLVTGLCLIFFISWIIFGLAKSDKLIELGRHARQPFVDDIIAKTAQKGLHLVADEIAPLRLRRIK